MSTKPPSTRAITPPFRASYPFLHEARMNDMSGKEEFSVTALFSKGDDLTALKAACKVAAAKKFGKDPEKWKKIGVKWPFRDQGDRERDDGTMPEGYEHGHVFLNLKSKKKPGVIDQAKKKIEDSVEIYSGVWLRASVNAAAYDVSGNKGVSLYLNNIQKVKEGTPIGGGQTRAEDDFEALEGAADDLDTESSDEDFMS